MTIYSSSSLENINVSPDKYPPGVTTTNIPAMKPSEDSFNLNHLHPDYLITKDARLKSRNLFEGTSIIKQASIRQNYLYKEKNESPDDYDFRVKRSVLEPWIEKLSIAQMSLIFSKPHERELSKDIEIYKSNVDLKGTSADIFFFDVCKDAKVDGLSFVEITMPPLVDEVDDDGNVKPRTKAVDIITNHRPYFNKVSGFNVLDWSIGEDKQLDWVVVYDPKQVRRTKTGDSLATPWGYPLVEVPLWKVWTRNAWYIYGLQDGSSASSPTFVIKDSGTHPLGIVPLVPFYGIKYAEFAGWPIAKSVLDAIILIYNKTSDLDHFERLASHPIPYTIGKNAPQKILSGKGIHLPIDADVPTASIGYLETNGAGFDSLRQSIADLRFSVFSAMLTQSKKDTAQVQSKDGQREDKRIFNTSLRSSALQYQNAEQLCWLLLYSWAMEGAKVTEENAPSIAKITYNKDFDDTVIETEMIKTLSTLVLNNQYPLELFLRRLKHGELIDPEVTEEDLLKMIKEDQEREGSSFPVFRPSNLNSDNIE
jgi:hypothetical protein